MLGLGSRAVDTMSVCLQKTGPLPSGPELRQTPWACLGASWGLGTHLDPSPRPQGGLSPPAPNKAPFRPGRAPGAGGGAGHVGLLGPNGLK